MESLTEGSPYWVDQVEAEKFRLKVRKAAQAEVYAEVAEGLVIPEGCLIDDELPPEPPELIPGILLRHGATGIIGCKEVGKTTIALEIQHSLLTGIPLWESIIPTATIEKSVHLIAEHTSNTVMGLYQYMGLSKTGRLRVFGPEHLQSMKLLISNGIRREESVEFYKKLVKGAGLVVFDPIAAFIQGQSAENDNSPMRNLIDSFIEIAQSTNAACLVLGHQGKPQFFQGKHITRSSYATRGASATEDALTAVHYLNQEDGIKINNQSMFKLKPIHYKGNRAPAFKLLRDPKTSRHTLYVGS